MNPAYLCAMYYLLLVIFYPLSFLPLWWGYLWSDLAYVLLYKVFGYRKKVVWDNIHQSFPEKSNEEKQMIVEDFYRNFCDQWIETIKLLSIPLNHLEKRMNADWNTFNSFSKDKQKVYTFWAHQFNFEWGNVICGHQIHNQWAGFYLPLNSKAFDRLLVKMRSRTGTHLIPTHDVKPGLKVLDEKYPQHVLGMVADQTPANLDKAVWYQFLNRPTPFFQNPEKSAKKAEAAVVFGSMNKVKRGYYKIEFEYFCENAALIPEGEITKAYVRFLEKQLKQHPSNWLWTHRRWKRKKPEDAPLYSLETNG